MPKAARVLAALKRVGRVEVRRTGSHRRLEKGNLSETWAFHDSKDLGAVEMAQVARQFGYTLAELRTL